MRKKLIVIALEEAFGVCRPKLYGAWTMRGAWLRLVGQPGWQ